LEAPKAFSGDVLRVQIPPQKYLENVYVWNAFWPAFPWPKFAEIKPMWPVVVLWFPGAFRK